MIYAQGDTSNIQIQLTQKKRRSALLFDAADLRVRATLRVARTDPRLALGGINGDILICHR